MLEIDKVYSYKSTLYHSARRFILRFLPNDIPVVPTTVARFNQTVESALS